MHTEHAVAAQEQSLQDGRSERFSALYERQHRSILRYAWRRVGPDRAEDIAHETFAVAWRRLDDMPSAGELPWLYQVAGNVIRNSARVTHRDSAILAALPSCASSTSAPASTPDHAEAVTARQVALATRASLSEGDRELLALIAWEGPAASADARSVCLTSLRRSWTCHE
jgi:RNA polymerase sigma-70 factor (ECF subfamily)